MEIIKGIHWIQGINGNCYIIADENLTLIDTGLPHRTKKILRYITQEMNRKPTDLKTIVLTHSHFDHIGNAEQLRALTGARIAAHQEDAAFIERKKRAPVPAGGMGLLFKVLSPFIRVRPFTVDTVLHENDKIAGLTIVFTPGHTPGSISLFDSKRKVLFTGDTIRYINGSLEGPSERFSVDPARARSSIQKLKTLEFDIMLGGHGTPLTENASAKFREFLEKY